MSWVYLAVFSVAALFAQASPPAPQPAGIKSVITTLNKALQRPDITGLTALFSNDGDLRIGDNVVSGPKAIAERLTKRRPWDEVTPPRIENESVRLITADVAIVDASWVQYGSTIARRAEPVVLVMKKQGEQWRVVSLRLQEVPLAARQP